MKKYSGLLIIILLILTFTGCADRPADEASQPPQQEESTAPILAVGETVTIDGACEFHVDQVTISENPDFYFEAEDGRAYVDFCITYQHLAGHTIKANQIMDGKLIYSGQYEYSGVAVACEEDGSSWSYAHTVQMGFSDTRQVHYFFAVPKEVQDSSRMVELHMNIRENDYRVIVREGEKGAVPGSQDSIEKASGAVADGELVTTGDGEFYIEHAEFSKKVMPPSPNTGYNYYEAEDGKIYLDICIAYKNLSNKQIVANKAVSASLKQAEAQTTVTEQLERSMFDYSNTVSVLPLCTEYIHWIFQVPEEMAAGKEELTVSLKIDGKRYTYSVK